MNWKNHVSKGILCMLCFMILCGFNSYAGEAEPYHSDIYRGENVTDEANASETEEEFHDKAKKTMDDIYYNAVDEVLNSKGDGITIDDALDGYYYAYHVVADVAPYMIVFSLLIGAILCAISVKNKGLRKWAFLWFIIFIPLVLIIFRYGIGILIGIMS